MSPPGTMLSENSRKGAKIPWSIKPINLYKIFTKEAGEDDPLSGSLLADMSVTGRLFGSFRFIISGPKIIEIKFEAASITNIPGAAEFILTMEVRPEDIVLRPNLLSSKWEDLADMVAKGRILASRGEDDGGHDFLGE